ncbi:MAG: hypothetical protein FJX78_06190 [Armatimonadetes bacterium]|nr:hypothetical protein [Armatimonadota bacterium]
MTLLSLCQDAATEIGIAHPSAIVGQTSVDARRLLLLAREEARSLLRRGWHQLLGAERTFTSVATETQTSILPSDFSHFIPGTFWNRSRHRPFVGPLTPQEWQQTKGWTTSPATDSFTQRADAILLNPVPSAGDTFAFGYVKNTFCQSSGGTAQSDWLTDSDVGVLPEELIRLGIIWRYKQSRGFATWQADYSKYEAEVRQRLMNDGPRRTLSMDGDADFGEVRRGFIVPEGDWML